VGKKLLLHHQPLNTLLLLAEVEDLVAEVEREVIGHLLPSQFQHQPHIQLRSAVEVRESPLTPQQVVLAVVLETSLYLAPLPQPEEEGEETTIKSEIMAVQVEEEAHLGLRQEPVDLGILRLLHHLKEITGEQMVVKLLHTLAVVEVEPATLEQMALEAMAAQQHLVQEELEGHQASRVHQ
jgi:hypothetical protein